jgi:phosphate starvation-inducible PhoH-like protein
MTSTPDTEHPQSLDFTLAPEDNERLRNLCGQLDEHLRLLEQRLGIEVNNRGNHFHLLGSLAAIEAGEQVLRDLYLEAADDVLTPSDVHLQLQSSGAEELAINQALQTLPDVVVKTKRGLVKPRGPHQHQYMHRVMTHDINFGVGPAGTGKTYLAVACAIDALERDLVRRILLVRPAVEAGERLGFLPGDLSQKIDPYLRPLYDALYEMLGFEQVHKLVERNIIEIAPLAYMRGRTLNESFVILDEAQNTTQEQMKMFLTRIGFGSTAVITGDVTQVDLPRTQKSGLRQVTDVLGQVEGISFTFFNAHDVVRHPLVQKVVQAYEKYDRVQERNGSDS